MDSLLHLVFIICSIIGIVIASLFLLTVAAVAVLFYGAGKLHEGHGTDWDERTFK